MVWFIIDIFYSDSRTWLTAKVAQLMLEVTTRSTLLRLMLLWGHLRSSTTLWTNTKFISIHFDLFCPPWINATSPQLAAAFSADWMRMLTKIMSPYGDWIQKKNKSEPYFVIQKKTHPMQYPHLTLWWVF